MPLNKPIRTIGKRDVFGVDNISRFQKRILFMEGGWYVRVVWELFGAPTCSE